MTAPNTTILSFRTTQRLIKVRLTKIFKNELPTNWITLFLHDYPQYKGNNNYFSEVKRAGTNKTGGIIPKEALLNELESWVDKKQNKKAKSKMITQLKLYYIKLKPEDKKDFKERVINRVKISESSFYRFLDTMPNILVKEAIADITELPIKQLYNTAI